MSTSPKPIDPSKPILKVVVAGGRNMTPHRDRLMSFLTNLILDPVKGLANRFNVVIVNGMAPGIDTFGGDWAADNGIWQIFMPADWNGPAKKLAGHLRNVEMAKESHAVFVIWDGETKGSRCMLSASLIMGNRTTEIVVTPEGEFNLTLLSRGNRL